MFNKRLQQLRKSVKLTQDELANRLSINRGTYANYERGHRQPDFDTLIKIADYFDVSTDFLLGREEVSPTFGKENSTLYDQLGISEEEFGKLTAYQQEVLEWAATDAGPIFKNKSTNALDMLERLEIAYEVYRVMEARKNKK